MKERSLARAWLRMSGKVALGFSGVFGLLASVLPMRTARAEPPPALRVAGLNATCPTARQVATELERMLPRTKITVDLGPQGAPEVTIFDQGAQFRVTIAGQERSFDDAARQCAERARHAAVFLALVLDPLLTAELSTEPPAPQAPPALPVVTVRPPSEPPTKPMSWEMTLGGVLHVAPEGDGRQTTVAEGVALFARAKRGFHLGLGAGVQHGTLGFDVAQASAWWIPIDVTAGFSTRATAWELGAEVGPNVSILSIVGENLSQASPQWGVEIGGRVSVWSRFWLSQQFAAFLSAETVVRPFPHALDIDPRGTIGHTPALWVGGSAGVAASL